MFLVQKRALDRGFAAAKKRGEPFQFNFEGLVTGSIKIAVLSYAQTAETSGIDESELSSGSQLRDRVGVLCDFFVRPADQETSRHPEMHNPLGRFAASNARRASWSTL